MSTRRLKRLRGNRVFEIAEQLGLHESTEEEEEEEYESESSSTHNNKPSITSPHSATDTVSAIIDIINKSEQQIQIEHQNQNQNESQITDEDKKRRKRNKKKAKKKRQQKKKAEEEAKKKSALNKKKNKNKNKNKNKKGSKKPQNTDKNKNKNKNKKSPSKSNKNDEEEKKQDKTDEMYDDICTQWDLLTCDTRYFDPNFELKRKYGSIALEANNEYIQNENARNKPKNTKQNRMIKKKQKQLNNKYGHLQKRKITLIKFNSTKWPTPYIHFAKKTGNIYMDLIYEDKKSNVKYFQFKYDNDYNRTQMEYKQRCARFNPEEISFLLQQHPYHVDTCLTMSDILSKHGRLEDAVDMVERGLYRLETGLHSRFSFITSDCRLDYSLIENRSFFLCLWKYSQNLGRRGCVHSSFELTKSLLSLSPLRDPLCSLLCLDYWALRANEYEWILNFSKSFKINIFEIENERQELDSLRMYPNWCFSVALSKYFVELKQSYQNKKQNEYLHQYKFGDCDNRKIPMDLSQIDGLSASILIQQALLMFPEIIGPLLSKANDRILGQSQWKIVMENEYFLKAKLRRNNIECINKLCKIYSERAHALWNNDNLLKWLWKHCQFIIARLKNPKSFRIDDIDDELVEFEDLSVFNGIRDSVYDNNTNKKGNKFHMLDVNEFSDVITTLPVEELPDALMRPQRINMNDLMNLNGDELNRIVDQLLAAGIELPPEIQQRLQQGQNLQNQNVLSAMLYSMMPWVNPIVPNNNNNNNRNDENKNDEKDDNQ